MFKKQTIKAWVFPCLFLFLISCKESQDTEYAELPPVKKLENYYLDQIKRSVIYLDSLQAENEIERKKHFYIQSRNSFKQAEAILAFAEKKTYKALNAPNILKVEEEDETNIKSFEPFGYQVIEENLFAESIDPEALQKAISSTRNRMNFIQQNTEFNFQNYHILWLIRDEIIRISTLGITGFDSPVLERSLQEAGIVYTSIGHILEIFKSEFKRPDLYESWKTEIERSIQSLDTNFNDFDRYSFIKDHTHMQLELWKRTREDWNADFPVGLPIGIDAESLFERQTFNLDYFTAYNRNNQFTEAKAELGKRLFEDSSLSNTKTMSCATCHQADKAFTDGLTKFEGQIRNTPTLGYAALQKAFFYDNRSRGLEKQIVAVINAENEFHSDLEKFSETVASDSTYVKEFDKLYKRGATHGNIRNAIASYIRDLMPFNSKFDNNINGIENSLSSQEIKGFNLFMGKAKCATCHFAPVFNGTIPPEFLDTEMELLGVPKDTSANSSIDPDLGRYTLMKTESRKFFFKTPTLRNIALTAPYMHNGVYTNLEQVMEFYNNGGGAGLGIIEEYQTLPPDSLDLNEEEMEAIIAFMESLTDKRFQNEKPL
ncbi:methylamine utilization protein [Gramella sp. GC03-9]|uniref:Methylamine utilization protein n=1 Tax=Christiangramia oceanisediminis TaxID=2920386 RepID=A0A9X2RED7_9FLAO|nr:cytochrome c peroxidase [Gramella oceanisediminis]MCP9201281.1 methylamine utilization protein [Gramella oceanisediminis]